MRKTMSNNVIDGMQVQFKELRGLYGNEQTVKRHVKKIIFDNTLTNEFKRQVTLNNLVI